MNAQPGKDEAALSPAGFRDIPGWKSDDHAAALACFCVSAARMAKNPYTTKPLGADALRLAAIGRKALALGVSACDRAAARSFFERHFFPLAVRPAGGAGFVTGYYEPDLRASDRRSPRYAIPIHGRPPDLAEIGESARPAGLDPSFRFARRTSSGLSEYPDRAAIAAGALDGMGLELAWAESAVDVFFAHIQGSARLLMEGGGVRRIAYAAKTGHPFTPIGRLLIERGELARDAVTMQTIRRWLESHPGQAPALMARNRSYIFFAETPPGGEAPGSAATGPLAAASVPLSPQRSLAVDRTLHTFGTPIFVATRDAFPGDADPLRRLMIAQDTGSAILGPARGDIFCGSGAAAGEIAGRVRHVADFFQLRPRSGAET